MSDTMPTECIAGDASGTRAGFRTRGCTCPRCHEAERGYHRQKRVRHPGAYQKILDRQKAQRLPLKLAHRRALDLRAKAIADLTAAGWSAPALSDVLCISVTTVRRVLRQAEGDGR